jgi:ribosomal protein S18 acetylase RimI-like enzyme
MKNLSIRRAVFDDAQRLAEIHVTSWQYTYRSLLPDEVIQRHTHAQRLKQCQQWLDPASTHIAVHLVAEMHQEILGFSVVIPSRDEENFLQVFELGAIYFAPEHIGKGHGEALLRASIDAAHALRASALTLWVLDTNVRARRFYERMGFVLDGGQKLDERIGGAGEVRYRFAVDASASTNPSSIAQRH